MDDDTDQTEVTVELYVRSLAPRAGRTQQESAIDRLDELVSAGQIDEFDVTVWGRRIGLSTAGAQTDAGQFVLGRVKQFREWARRTNRSLDSVFETRQVESSITNEACTVLVLPSLALAEYHDGDLAYVAPCSDGDSVYTVTDRIDVLEATTGAVAKTPLGDTDTSEQMAVTEEE